MLVWTQMCDLVCMIFCFHSGYKQLRPGPRPWISLASATPALEDSDDNEFAQIVKLVLMHAEVWSGKNWVIVALRKR